MRTISKNKFKKFADKGERSQSFCHREVEDARTKNSFLKGDL
uniref:Uncharacterized protein n=1 Tax=Siphoviridae sp. ctFSL3 TaxID=2825404 RepID=A0A8S5PES4_9CAUD|nr:MAG TPA: hypothetical protein [Siphoviridae sp. ctFSL3]